MQEQIQEQLWPCSPKQPGIEWISLHHGFLENAAPGGFGVIPRRHGEGAAMSWLLSISEGVARNPAVYGAARQEYEGNMEQARRIASLMDPNERAVISKSLAYINR